MDGLLGLLIFTFTTNTDCENIKGIIEKKFCENLKEHIREKFEELEEDDLKNLINHTKELASRTFTVNEEILKNIESELKELKRELSLKSSSERDM